MTDVIDFYAKKEQMKKKVTTRWKSLPIDEDLWFPNGVIIKEITKDGISHYSIPLTLDEVRTLNRLDIDDIKWLPTGIMELYIEGEELPPILG